MYLWGEGRSELLGLEPAEEATPVSVPQKWDYLKGRRVEEVALGEKHALFLLQDGTVVSSGSNEKGQLGRRGNPLPEQIQALEAQTIVQVACGREHSVAVCNKGCVFSWGAGTEGQLGMDSPKEVNFIPKKIKSLSEVRVIQVACGLNHSLALSNDCVVYSWGQNTYGQLGLGKESYPLVPQCVKSLAGIPLAQVAAGGAHSFALSLSGSVFGWGKNNAGQLGLGKVGENGQFKPYKVVLLGGAGVTYICCGDEHTAALTKDGSIYTFGSGSCGQLGHNSTENESRPQRVTSLYGVSQVACGSHHTLAYVASVGCVYSFGCGVQGQLGNGTACNQTLPSPVHMTWNVDSSSSADDDPSNQVKKIFAGTSVSFLQTVPSLDVAALEQLHIQDTSQQISQINADLLRRWLAVNPTPGERNKTEREISLIFSSCSCLVASFLRNTEEPLSEGSTTSLDVDLQLVRKIFEQLTRNHWITVKIVSCLREKLIPSLSTICSHKEALAIYLILPEFLVMLDAQTSLPLVLTLADAVNNLNEKSEKILREWWSSLQEDYLIKHVQMIKTALHILFERWTDTQLMHQNAKSLLQVLKRLYKANLKPYQTLPLSEFYITIFLDYLYKDLTFWHIKHRTPIPENETEEAVPVIFCEFPFVLNLASKIQVFRFDTIIKKVVRASVIKDASMQQEPGIPPLPIFNLKVRRETLIEDTLRKLHLADDSELRKELTVEFVGENTSGKVGGVRKEFFLHVFEKMLHPEYGMFAYNEESKLMWFPTHTSVETKNYFLFGILCGLAIYNYCLVHLPFPLALFKKLLGKKPLLEDFIELDPVFGKSLQYLLSYEYDVEKYLNMSFSVSWQNQQKDLVPDGENEPVTNANRKRFVDTLVNYVFNESVEMLFNEFRRGFYKVCDQEILEFFTPQELMAVMVGNTDYDWQRLQQNTLYDGGYSPSHPTIIMFWNVFHDLPLNKKKDFLLFATGSDRIPPLGMDAVRIIFVPSKGSDFYMPEAYTCYDMIQLPTYTTVERLKERLLMALSRHCGFGIG
ncbi:probable E3 ubiquitin-protein ligase HERC6 isoform X3 [Latimeria chalumnae]|uniref:probable E3 ubiquitin-protein ligase HERC6 isoform X3 n=1 Tax=Latimeria chalumnae TaxID=7897 RepID=UPI00313C48CA